MYVGTAAIATLPPRPPAPPTMQQQLCLLVVYVQPYGFVPLPGAVHADGVAVHVKPLEVEGRLGLEGTLGAELLPHLLQRGPGVKVEPGLAAERTQA